MSVVTDAQVKRMQEKYDEVDSVARAAMAGDMSRNTASKYLADPRLPSQRKEVRNYRTREDPFKKDWALTVRLLEDAPELEAKTIFDWLTEMNPERYQENQLRTLQRHIAVWRAQAGPEQELFFEQVHRAGEGMQLDFTNADCLKVTIQHEPFPHLLGHAALLYSTWSFATVVSSESRLAVKRTLQRTLFELGFVPQWLQMDHSTAATHGTPEGREFNQEHLDLLDHYGLEGRTIEVGAKEQNGTIEALNGGLKRRLEQYLLLRGSRDFDSVEEWEAFVEEVCRKANVLKRTRLADETKVMRGLSMKRLPEYRVYKRIRVTTGGRIRVDGKSYSVPSRLKGQHVVVHLWEREVEVYFKGVQQMKVPRLIGARGSWTDYRHVIWSLVRKPGAFERYRYRDDLFPRSVFRRAYEALEPLGTRRKIDLEYLRILHLAAATMECDVALALDLLLAAGTMPLVEEIKALVASHNEIEIPELERRDPLLSQYDVLCSAVAGLSR